MKKESHPAHKADSPARPPVSGTQRAPWTTSQTAEPQSVGQPAYPLGPQTTPEQILQLQRLIGNRAVTKLVAQRRQFQEQDNTAESPAPSLPPPSPAAQPSPMPAISRGGSLQRRYSDLDLSKAESELGTAIFKKLQFYNTTAALNTLSGQARLDRREKDVFLLDSILDMIYEIHGLKVDTEPVKGWIDLLTKESNNLKQARNEGVGQEAAVKKETGTMTFPSFPTLAKPVLDGPVLPGVEFIEARINGKLYHLYAGQIYLNVKDSLDYFLKRKDTREGSIEIMLLNEQDSDKYTNAMIGDAHHRFIWGAYLGKPLTAEITPRGTPLALSPWSGLTYTHNPKHVFKFDHATKIFNAAISPLPEYRSRPKDNLLNFAIEIYKDLLNIPEVIFENDDDVKLEKYLTQLVSAANPTRYDVRVRELAAAAKNKEQAASIADILLESFAAGEAPDVAFGPTPSTGYYSAKYQVVVLDRVKNPSPDALLDTLAFETGNALRREAFLSDKKATTSIEFGTMEDYIKLLMEATHSGGINTLVVKLGIPEKYLTLANAKTILSMKEPALDMPKESEFPGQKLRSALAWWKMQDWTDEQRKQYFSTSAHAEGMEATGAGYKSGEEVKPSVQVKSSGQSQPTFKKVVLEMVRRYPRADQYHFDQLQPRHYGEFIRTGRIEKWHSEAKDEKTARPENLLVSFFRDLKTVYPNWDAWNTESLTNADFGDFLLNGKIKSWDKMGQ